jgi:Signal transduction histidine kinase
MDLNKLVGSEAAFPLEHRILNTVLLIGIVLSFSTSIANYLVKLELLAVISATSCLALSILYYLSMVKKAYRTVTTAAVCLGLVLTVVLWISTGGITGSTEKYILIYAAMIAVSIRNTVLIAALIGALMLLSTALVTLQYFYPHLIISYTSRALLYADNYMGLILALIVITFLHVVILAYYRREHKKATDYLLMLEKQEMALELARLDRLNLIGEMAASLGHEVRNPLTTVRGFLQLYRNKKDYEQHRDHFDLMINELDRANAIITEYLSLAKSNLVSRESCDLNHILERIFPLVQASALEEGKEAVLQLAKVPPVDADGQEIRQLVLNLTSNALDAVKPGGTVTVATYLEKDQTVLSVSDTGQGIPPEIYAKLGTPFLTDKPKGTGLGIPICFRIAERHNAKIEIDTGAQGTIFRVKFNTFRRQQEPTAQK